ncbi:MAG: PorV/PorQ family protein [Bacteroidota bacterium]
MKRTIYLAGLALLLASTAPAQSRIATNAAPFLTIGTGARGMSMGNAYTAMATGSDALFWNPGGAAIPYAERHLGSAFFSHYEWLADIDYNAAGVTIPITRSGVVGLSLAAVDYGDMEVRTEQNPNGTGVFFSSTDFMVGATYAQPLTPDFYFGGTVKYIRQSIRDMSASTVAFDFGFVLKTRYLGGLQIASSIMNFGGQMQMDGINGETNIDIAPNLRGSSESIPVRIRNDTWDLPLAFRFGAALPVVRSGNFELIATGDANQTTDNNLNADFGGLLRYGNRTFNLEMRGGYRDAFLGDDVDGHVSLGVGLDLQVTGNMRFGFDFAYLPFNFLNDTQLFDARVFY